MSAPEKHPDSYVALSLGTRTFTENWSGTQFIMGEGALKVGKFLRRGALDCCFERPLCSVEIRGLRAASVCWANERRSPTIPHRSCRYFSPNLSNRRAAYEAALKKLKEAN